MDSPGAEVTPSTRERGSVRFSHFAHVQAINTDEQAIQEKRPSRLQRQSLPGNVLSPAATAFSNVVVAQDTVRRWSHVSATSPRGTSRGSLLRINTPGGALPLSAQLDSHKGQSPRRSMSSRSSRTSRSGSNIEIVLGAGGFDNLPRTPKRKSTSRFSTGNTEDTLDAEPHLDSKDDTSRLASFEPLAPESNKEPEPESVEMSAPASAEKSGLEPSKESAPEGTKDTPDPSEGSSDSRPSRLKKFTNKVVALSAFNLLHRNWSMASSKPNKSEHENSFRERTLISEELSALPMFSSCSEKFLQELSRTIAEINISEGSEILQDDSEGPAMLLVLRGSVEVYMEDVCVLKLTQGQYFGEACLLGLEEEWRAQLIATCASTVCAVRRDELMKASRFFQSERRYFEFITEKNKFSLSEGTLTIPCPVFRGLSANTICKIDSLLLRRIYFPGDTILAEGRPSNELFILVRGRANVEIAGRCVRKERRDSQAVHTGSRAAVAQRKSTATINSIEEAAAASEDLAASVQDLEKADDRAASVNSDNEPKSDEESIASKEDEEEDTGGPICFGELALLGMQEVQTASVVAQAICHVRVLHRTNFFNILESNNESLQMDKMRKLRLYQDSHRPPKKVLNEVKIFKDVGCSENFIDFLAQHLEDRMFLNGQKIIDETQSEDRCMYLLAQGMVKVLKSGTEVATLASGAVFGEIIVLGLAEKRSATVVAAETCFMQILHQSVVVRGLELFPDERQKVLMMAFKAQKEQEKASMEAVDSSQDPAAVGENSEITRKRLSEKKASVASTGDAFLKALKQSPLFENVSPRFVEELSHVSQDRIYMPGDLIIEEGKRGDSMFIMVSGTATVFVSDPDSVSVSSCEQRPEPNAPLVTVNGERLGKTLMITENTKTFKKKSMSRIGVLTAGSISGELAMLGVSTQRSATIEASTICSMWEITQEKALLILECFPEAQRHFAAIIVSHLERTVPARILSLPLFRAFDRKFRMLLGLYCERTAYFPGQAIAAEGKPDTRLFIVNQGRATLEKKGVTVKTYAAGSHFGSTVMLGIHKVYLGSLFALQTCHVLIISRTSYQQALEQYPALVAAQDLKRSEKAAVEELREAIQRISTRKLIWKRYQCQLLDSMDPETKKLTDKELMERALQCWSTYARTLTRQRRKRELERKQHTKMMDDWVQKKRSAWERLQMKKAAAAEGGWPVLTSDISRPVSKDQKQRPATVYDPSPGKVDLAGVLQDWPAPRPSPHYRLRVFGVLYEAAERPPTSGTVLPLLKLHSARESSRGEAADKHCKNGVSSSMLSARGKSKSVRGFVFDTENVVPGDESPADAKTSETSAKARKSEEFVRRATLRSSDLQKERNSRIVADRALLASFRQAQDNEDDEDEDYDDFHCHQTPPGTAGSDSRFASVFGDEDSLSFSPRQSEYFMTGAHLGGCARSSRVPDLDSARSSRMIS